MKDHWSLANVGTSQSRERHWCYLRNSPTLPQKWCMHTHVCTSREAHMCTHTCPHTYMHRPYTFPDCRGNTSIWLPGAPLEMSPGGPWSSHSCTQAQQSEGTLSKTQLCLAVRKSRPTPPLPGWQGGEDQ